MSRFPFIVALLAGVVAARTAEPHPSLPPPVIPDCLGVNIHFTDPQPGELEMLAAAGFKWVRMDFGWGGTEPKKGEYDFSAYDRLVAALDKFQIRAVFILDYGNPLYAEPGDAHPFTSRAHTPEFREAFGKWAVAAVRHFQGRGYLWEMWNEPNGGFWKSPDKTGDYIALAKSTGEALRQAGLLGPKGEAYIGPATSTIDLPYLEACFQAGLLDYWDAVSVHPYRSGAPETVEEQYRSVRLLIRKYAPKDKVIPIISGEWGYSSAWPGMGQDEAARAEQQGKFLPRQFLTNVANDIALSIWYDWRDDGADPNESEQRFGIVSNEYHAGRDPVYDPKPAYVAMKTLAQQLGGYHFNKAFRYFPESRVPELFVSTESEDARGGVRDYSCPEMQLWVRDKSLALVSWIDKRELTIGEFPARYSEQAGVDYLGRNLALPEGPQEEWKFSVGDGAEYRFFGEFEKTPWLLAAWKKLPLEIVGVAPTETKVEVSMTNPFPYRLILPGWRESQRLFDSPEIWDPGKYEELYGESTEFLPAGKTVTRDYKITLGRIPSRFVEQVPVEFLYGSTRTVFTQNLHYSPLNPLTVQFVGATGGEIVPRVPGGATLLEGFLAELKKQFPVEKEFNRALKEFQRPERKNVQVFFEIADEAGGPLPSEISLENRSSDVSGPSNKSPIVFEKGQRKALVKMELSEVDRSTGFDTLSLGQVGSMKFELKDVRTLPINLENLVSIWDGQPNISGKCILTAAGPLDSRCPIQTPSVKVEYHFGAGWKFLQLAPRDRHIDPEGKGEDEDRPQSFGLWIYGDGKGCQPRVRFTDATGQTFQPDGSKIDWKGWRYATFRMQVLEGRPLTHWGGANDGIIHYPIKWDAIFLLDNPSRQEVSGEIYLSAPTLLY